MWLTISAVTLAGAICLNSVCIDAEQQIFWLFSALQANCARAKDAASAMACGALFNERSEKNAMRKTQE